MSIVATFLMNTYIEAVAHKEIIYVGIYDFYDIILNLNNSQIIKN